MIPTSFLTIGPIAMAPPSFIYVMKDLRKVVPPSREILRGIWLSFYYGAKIGVLGANGAGKSSLLRIMAGVDQDFQGEAWAAEGTRIGFLPQEPQLDPTLDVRGNVELAVKAQRALLQEFQDISMAFAEPMGDSAMEKLLARQARVQEQIDAHDLWNLDNKIEIAMDALRLPPAGRRREQAVRRRAPPRRAVPRAVGGAGHPAARRADEPSRRRKRRVARALSARLPGHRHRRHARSLLPRQRRRLDSRARPRLRHSVRGQLHVVARAEALAACPSKRRPSRRGSARCSASSSGCAWRRARDRRRTRRACRSTRRWSQQETAEKILQHEIVIPPPPRLGNDVVTARDVKKAFGDKVLLDGFSFDLPRGGIVGIIGPNGAGKTTLFRMIVGQETPDSGTLKVGETVQIAYSDQSRTLDGEKSAWQEISGGQELIMVGKKELNSRAYLSSFNFRGTDQQKKVGLLSGGERNRLHLAKTLMSGGNLLLLDEPTNDLDVDTLRALEDALVDFAGCAVVISHDRWFLDRIATHILAFEGNSEVVWHEGNYQSYIEDLQKRKGADADQPHRVAYKKLVRA